MRKLDLVEIADLIRQKVQLLEKGRGLLENAAKEKSCAISTYDKKLAVVLIKLKNGQTLSLEGNEVTNPPATISEKIAKGICSNEKLDMELAEARYKCVLSKQESIQAELNGYQSIFRHLEKM